MDWLPDLPDLPVLRPKASRDHVLELEFSEMLPEAANDLAMFALRNRRSATLDIEIFAFHATSTPLTVERPAHPEALYRPSACFKHLKSGFARRRLFFGPAPQTRIDAEAMRGALWNASGGG